MPDTVNVTFTLTLKARDVINSHLLAESKGWIRSSGTQGRAGAYISSLDNLALAFLILLDILFHLGLVDSPGHKLLRAGLEHSAHFGARAVLGPKEMLW